ncbi:hypothetical protein QFZ77_005455 [Paenibacillus sp. V4I3]|uniref:PIN-like domain-containing protein n=1 Tax=Paenibacillus sp. V4I3 TaxID=3042305 RepID=UPI0027867E93|nr:PIN-like domain-containing protein [Paenibacillus sp. V4I3]MDQ0876796.1 hypothetical protein [Paenibacillus sp. V4I3]
MKDLFPGYYKPTEQEFQTLWSEALFVFDANVLLNFYRYSQQLREVLLSIFKKIDNRIWISHQAALEYHFNRTAEINKQENAYENIIAILDKKLNDNGELNQYKKHQLIDILEINKSLSDLFNQLKLQLMNQRESHGTIVDFDHTSEILSDLLNGKIGEPFDNAELQELYKKGEDRYTKKLPPGFDDASKKEKKYFEDLIIEEKFGDFIIWSQTINKAKETNKPVIFITDDAKSDWWYRPYGKTIGPHPHLIQEMKKEANVSFYMYQTDQFIQFAKKYLETEDSIETISNVVQEIKEVRKSNESALQSEFFSEKILSEFIYDEKDLVHMISVVKNNGNSVTAPTTDSEINIAKIALRMQFIDRKFNIKSKSNLYTPTRTFLKTAFNSDLDILNAIETPDLSRIFGSFLTSVNDHEYVQTLLDAELIDSSFTLTAKGISFLKDSLLYKV